MRPALANLVACPECQGRLTLSAAHQQDEDVVSGALSCPACQRAFPITEGVPRIYRNAWQIRGRWREHLSGVAPRWDLLDEDRGTVKSRESFSHEWAAHRPGDVTWLWRVQERVNFFAEETGLVLESIKDKWLLDAGCGNGELTIALAEGGANVVGLDLSRSVERAEAMRTTSRVHFVQGDLTRVPLQPETFDVIYSSGVLHHTRNARGAFEGLARCLKPGGRMYIWMYGTPRAEDLPAYTAGRESDYWLKTYLRPLPAPVQRIAVVPRALRHWLRTRREGVTFPTAMVLAMDALTPYYRTHQHVPEMRGWFDAAQFRDVTLSGVREPGFGVYGTKPS